MEKGFSLSTVSPFIYFSFHFRNNIGLNTIFFISKLFAMKFLKDKGEFNTTTLLARAESS